MYLYTLCPINDLLMLVLGKATFNMSQGLLCLFRFEYHWADGTTVKKPIKCSAPKYIDYLMTWVQEQVDDENLFPSKIGKTSVHVQCVVYLLHVCTLSVCVVCMH